MVVVYGVNVHCAYDLSEWVQFGYGNAAGMADLAIENNWFPDLDIKWLYANKCQKLSVRSNTFVGCLHCSLTDALHLSDDLQDIFVRLNDNDCFSFNEIADYIETNLKDI